MYFRHRILDLDLDVSFKSKNDQRYLYFWRKSKTQLRRPFILHMIAIHINSKHRTKYHANPSDDSNPLY